MSLDSARRLNSDESFFSPRQALANEGENSPLPVAEFWSPPTSFARGRALPPEWVAEPESEGALIPANLPRRRDGVGKIGGGINPPPKGHPRNRGSRRCLAVGTSLRKFREGEPMSPIHFHAARLPQRRASVHRARDQARGIGNIRLKIHFPVTFRFGVRF